MCEPERRYLVAGPDALLPRDRRALYRHGRGALGGLLLKTNDDLNALDKYINGLFNNMKITSINELTGFDYRKSNMIFLHIGIDILFSISESDKTIYSNYTNFHNHKMFKCIDKNEIREIINFYLMNFGYDYGDYSMVATFNNDQLVELNYSYYQDSNTGEKLKADKIILRLNKIIDNNNKVKLLVKSCLDKLNCDNILNEYTINMVLSIFPKHLIEILFEMMEIHKRLLWSPI